MFTEQYHLKEGTAVRVDVGIAHMDLTRKKRGIKFDMYSLV